MIASEIDAHVVAFHDCVQKCNVLQFMLKVIGSWTAVDTPGVCYAEDDEVACNSICHI